MKNVAVWFPFAALSLAALYAVIVRFVFARERTVDELALMLRHIDLPLLERLLDPQEEAGLRRLKSARAFRLAQIGRLAAAGEQLGRVSHNAAAFRRWGVAEFKKIEPKNRTAFDKRDVLIIEVIRYATEVKRHAFYAAAKIRFWQLMMIARWPMLPSPSLSDLREVLGVDWLNSYEQLTGAAAQLMHNDGPEAYDQVMAAL